MLLNVYKALDGLTIFYLKSDFVACFIKEWIQTELVWVGSSYVLAICTELLMAIGLEMWYSYTQDWMQTLAKKGRGDIHIINYSTDQTNSAYKTALDGCGKLMGTAAKRN